MPLFLALLLLGPKETLAGKFPVHVPEYLQRYPEAPVPLPDPLPTDVDALCRLVEAGHATPGVYAALGDALFAKGDKALAYRAFHKAQALGDAALGRRMQERKDQCGYVDPLVIAEEERQARIWVEALRKYEETRIYGIMGPRGDPRDLEAFYEQYGRAEDDLVAHARSRRIFLVVRAVGVGLLLVFFFALCWRITKKA
ncbi:MAG: hypothetical protein ACHQ1G_09250 [Planctomycetota bacterium]